MSDDVNDVEMSASEQSSLKLEPIKIGWLGSEWRGFEREIRMAFDEGTENELLDRRSGNDVYQAQHQPRFSRAKSMSLVAIGAS